MIDTALFLRKAQEICDIANKKFQVSCFSPYGVEITISILNHRDHNGCILTTSAKLYSSLPYPIIQSNVMGDYIEALDSLKKGIEESNKNALDQENPLKFSKLN